MSKGKSFFILGVIVLLGVFLTTPAHSQDLGMVNNTLRAQRLGVQKSLMRLLLLQSESSFSVTQSGTTFSTIALDYYGSSDFAILIARGNNKYRFGGTDVLNTPFDVLVIPTTLRLPNVLYCQQFVSVDCIKQSYDASLLSSVSPSLNFWKSLPSSLLATLADEMKFPNYITFAMTILTNKNLYPPTMMTLQIQNNLDMDLTKGRISYITGGGDPAPAFLNTASTISISATQANVMQGIHGTLYFSVNQGTNDLPQTLWIHFHVYATNGTFINTVTVNDLLVTQDIVSPLNIPNIGNCQVFVSQSPDAQIFISLTPAKSSPDWFLSGPSLFQSYDGWALDAATDVYSGMNVLRMAPNLDFRSTQSWQIIKVQTGLEYENIVRIVNKDSTLALEANTASANVTLETPDSSNTHQLWEIIETTFTYNRGGNPGVFYKIKATGSNFCWAFDYTFNNPTQNPLYARLALESCVLGYTNQLWQGYVYYQMGYDDFQEVQDSLQEGFYSISPLYNDSMVLVGQATGEKSVVQFMNSTVDANDNSYHLWIKRASNSFYTIIDRRYGRCLQQPSQQGLFYGVALTPGWYNDNSCNWRILVKNGTYLLSNQAFGGWLYFDIPTGWASTTYDSNNFIWDESAFWKLQFRDYTNFHDHAAINIRKWTHPEFVLDTGDIHEGQAIQYREETQIYYLGVELWCNSLNQPAYAILNSTAYGLEPACINHLLPVPCIQRQPLAPFDDAFLWVFTPESRVNGMGFSIRNCASHTYLAWSTSNDNWMAIDTAHSIDFSESGATTSYIALL